MRDGQGHRNRILSRSQSLPTRMWSFADIRCAQERPYLGYLVSALIALTISLPVSFVFYLFRLQFPLDSNPILPFQTQCK